MALVRRSRTSPYSYGIRIWRSGPCYRHFKTTIFPAPLTYSWVQPGRPTICYYTTPRCTKKFVVSNRDLTKYPPTCPPSRSHITDSRPLLPLSAALQLSPRLPKPVVEPIDDLYIRSCVEHDTYTNGAREQRAGPLCSATLQVLALGSPVPPSDDVLDNIPRTRRPLYAEVQTVATKVSYTLPTTTPFFSSTDHTRTQRVLALLHTSPLPHPPAYTFQC